MEIVVLVLGLVGFVMSFVIVGAAPAALALLLGVLRLLIKKKTDKAWQDRDNHRDRVFRYRDNSQSVCVFCRRDGY